MPDLNLLAAEIAVAKAELEDAEYRLVAWGRMHDINSCSPNALEQAGDLYREFCSKNAGVKDAATKYNSAVRWGVGD